MPRAFRFVSALLVVVPLCWSAAARAATEPTQSSEPKPISTRCIALPLPTLRGAEGSATDLATGVRDLVSSFLTGPSLRTVVLGARLAELAAEEAREKDCGAVLTIALTRRRSGGGGLGRMLGDAAGAAAWHLPYGGSAAKSTAIRSAAIAGSSAVSRIAANTRARDEMQIEYRLSSDDRTTLREGKDRAKATADGEDLMTPLIERMAAAIVAAVRQ